MTSNLYKVNGKFYIFVLWLWKSFVIRWWNLRPQMRHDSNPSSRFQKSIDSNNFSFCFYFVELHILSQISNISGYRHRIWIYFKLLVRALRKGGFVVKMRVENPEEWFFICFVGLILNFSIHILDLDIYSAFFEIILLLIVCEIGPWKLYPGKTYCYIVNIQAEW